jgi:hypothetical protein
MDFQKQIRSKISSSRSSVSKYEYKWCSSGNLIKTTAIWYITTTKTFNYICDDHPNKIYFVYYPIIMVREKCEMRLCHLWHAIGRIFALSKRH